MMNRSQLVRFLLSMTSGFGFLVVVGCSADDGLGKRYSVSGQVTYKGEPVAKGVINFVPEEGSGGRGATGTIDNGYYSLTTLTQGDGALPGKYKVTVDTRSIDEAAAKEATRKFLEKNKVQGVEPQFVPQEVQSKLLAQTRSSIPGKYQIPETTDLTATVEEKSNTINFELKD